MRTVILLVVTAAAFALSLFCGSVHFPAADVIDVLTGDSADSAAAFIILESRLPRALTAILASAALAVAGLLLQTAFRNPLAGPSIMGVSSGASLGVAIVTLAVPVMSVGAGAFAVTVTAALAGSMAVMAILIAMASWLKNNLMLLIAGIMLGYLASSMITLLNYTATPDSIRGFVVWGMGSFSNVDMHTLPYFGGAVVLGLLPALFMAKPLNSLLLGENYARNLGVAINRARMAILLITGLLTGAATAFCGPVAFIGLAVPHIAALIYRTADHRRLIPACMLCGAATGLVCNVLCSATSRQLPLNAITPIIGVPIILYILLRRRRAA